jgi:hypothetical protein
MTTAGGRTEAITTTVNRYLETVSQGRPDDIAALYAEDATGARITSPSSRDFGAYRRGSHCAAREVEVRDFYATAVNLASRTTLA